MSSEKEINLQRKYYADTAAKYDAMQLSDQDEHQFALAILSAMIWQGGKISRWVKQAFNAFGLWPVVNFIRTGGKRYCISEGDGLFYSYSVFNNYEQIRASCGSVHLINTVSAGPDLYRSAPHLALFGLKK